MTESIATVSDIFRGSSAAAAVAADPVADSEAVGARTRGRASLAATERDGNSLVASIRADVVNAWPWSSTPPALRDVAKSWRADRAAVPGANVPLQAAWTVYNVAVALPVTAVGYLLTWILQHPARLAAALIVATPLLLFLA